MSDSGAPGVDHVIEKLVADATVIDRDLRKDSLSKPEIDALFALVESFQDTLRALTKDVEAQEALAREKDGGAGRDRDEAKQAPSQARRELDRFRQTNKTWATPLQRLKQQALMRDRATTRAKDDDEDEADLRMTQMQSTLEEIGKQGEAVNQDILESNENLHKIGGVYKTFSNALGDASVALAKLKAQSAKDQKFIWYAFSFYCAVCLQIILRRMGVFFWVWQVFEWILYPIWSITGAPFLESLGEIVADIWPAFLAG